jgi:hypothetical protein
MGTKQLRGILGVLLAVGMMAGADPMFSIETLPEWQDAWDTGLIEPVPGPVFQDMVVSSPGLWPQEYEQAFFATPELYVMEHTDSAGDTHPGLVMYWGQGDVVGPPGGPPEPIPSESFVAAAWDYVYPTDPDLTNLRLEFSIHVPGPGMFFSLNLIDEEGDFMEWVWQANPDPAIPDFPWCRWTTVEVDPNTGWTNWGSALVSTDRTGAPGPFMGGPTGVFDLDRVTRIRFDEMGIWMDPALITDFQGQPWLWNAWDHVEVSPEPGTMLLLGGGLAVLLRRRRRR